MGNCNKNLQPKTSTNFSNDKWQTKQSNIHPCCQILINNFNPQIKVYKWLSTNPLKHNKQTKRIRQKKDKKQQYLPTIYQVGYLSDRSSIDNKSNIQQQKNQYQYIITQQLIRLKDIILSQSQAVIISYSSLLAYRKMFLQFNGFIAKQNMIYINRQGIIKIWINQNLCDNYLEYPYPTITEKQFISSLLHQIFACMQEHVEYCKIYCYIKNGLICFNQVIAKLQYYMRQHGLGSMLHIPRDTFNTLLDRYQQKQGSDISKTRLQHTDSKLNKKQQKHSKTLYQQSKLKFMVADNITQDNKKYIKDYSNKYKPEQSSRNYSYSMINGQNNMSMPMYNNNINYQVNSYYYVKNYVYSNNNSVIVNQYYDV